MHRKTEKGNVTQIMSFSGSLCNDMTPTIHVKGKTSLDLILVLMPDAFSLSPVFVGGQLLSV